MSYRLGVQKLKKLCAVRTYRASDELVRLAPEAAAQYLPAAARIQVHRNNNTVPCSISTAAKRRVSYRFAVQNPKQICAVRSTYPVSDKWVRRSRSSRSVPSAAAARIPVPYYQISRDA